jgi:hypothetical protein
MAHRAIVPFGETLPPPRPGVRHVRVLRRCTIVADDELRLVVDRWFHWPMIVLALAVLPLLAVELFYLDRMPDGERSWLGVLCWVGFGAIWLAFVVEFIIKIAIAESRIEYVRRNWLDVVIILVPALRPLRATSIVRTGRVFKLRGVGMKLFRYGFGFIVGLDATDHYLQKVGIKRARGAKPAEQMTRDELMDEVRRLRQRCDTWEQWHKAEQEFLQNSHKPLFDSIAHPTPAQQTSEPAARDASPYNPADEDLPRATQSDCR